MKDIMQKLAELEATAPKVTKKKMLNEDSTTPPINVSNKPASFKDVFENMAMQKQPIPVVGKEGDTTQTGAGFLNVTDNSPAAQALSNALGDLAGQKKVQIVVPTQPGQQATAAGQPAQAGATGQQPAGQTQVKEKWDTDTKVAPSEKGKYAGKDKAELTKAYNKLKASGPHKKGSPEFGKMRELAFAIRAKSDWGKVQEEQLDELSPKTLKSYAKKADIDHVVTNRELKNRYHTGLDPELLKKSQNRNAGMKMAGDKLGGRAKVPANEGAKVDRMVKHIEKSEKKLGKSKDEAEDIAWATANKRGMLDNKNKKKVKEADIAPTSSIDTRGAGLGAGRSQTTLEGKKPDFLDLDKKEPMKKAAADKKKKKVDESMNRNRINAARLEGKSHGLRGHAHHGKAYEDLDEMRAYHEGYKEGMDELYEMGMYETAPAATVGGMASQAMPTMEDDMEEGNAFTAALAKTPKGGKFSVGGKTFTDRTDYNAKIDEYTFESLDKQLNELLTESEEVNEGLSVSISKGQQNSPDSVTITAQDQEAEHLLAFVKNAGLGLFGDDHDHSPSSAMSIQPAHGAPDEVGAGGVDVEVVDGHDGMMGLMQKLSGIQSAGGDDYEDEEGGEEQLYGNHQAADKKDCGCDGDCECSDYDKPSNEGMCNECGGMMEAGHSCGSKMDEEQTLNQLEADSVSEDNAPDSDEAETTADEYAGAKQDAALAGEKEEEMNESFASLLDRLTKLAEGSGDKPKHPEHDKKDDKDFDDAEPEEEVNEAKESTHKKDEKAEKAGKKVAKDIEYDEGHKGKDDNKAEKAGKKVTKDIEYDDKKEKIDEWANDAGKKGTDASFEQDIDFMTRVISGGLNKPKSTGQTTVPVIAGQTDRMSNPKETVTESVSDWVKLAGIK